MRASFPAEEDIIMSSSCTDSSEAEEVKDEQM